MFKNKAVLLIASAVLAMPGLVQAQGVTPTAGGKGGTVAAEQIIARYASLAGSEANAKSLVNGLRNGSNITLTGEQKVCSEFEQTKTCKASTETRTCIKTETRRVSCPVNPLTCPTGFRTEQVCTEYQTTSTCTDWTTTPTSTCKVWGTQTSSDTFSPGAAAPMGFGNVDIALALTEAKLRPNATPAAADLKAALLEILNKRAGGEGWGEIAKSYGFELK